MIICLDVGNTNIKYALYNEEERLMTFRVATELKKTSDEYGEQLIGILKNKNFDVNTINGGIISSVVPQLDYTLDRMLKTYLKITPLIVGTGIKSGLNLKVDNAKEVGADRVVNNVAAVKKYGYPAIVVDFGTATTFNVINNKCEFIGGVIAPGIKTSLDSLVNGTAKLPRVEIVKPDKVIGTNTITNMQSGIVYGFSGLVEYIVIKIKKELNQENVKVIATGGFSEVISKEIKVIDIVDKYLTLDGLQYLYTINNK